MRPKDHPYFTDIMTCGEDSLLYHIMARRMKVDGRYKYKDRGSNIAQVNAVSTKQAAPSKLERQEDAFSDGL